MLEEPNCLIQTCLYIPKVRYHGYRAQTNKCKSLLHCTESLKYDNIEIYLIYRCKRKITAEFYLPIMTQN